MRVAFCFSGLSRGINISKDFWLKQIEKYNADVFGSFWDDNLSEVELFNKLFKPKSLVLSLNKENTYYKHHEINFTQG